MPHLPLRLIAALLLAILMAAPAAHAEIAMPTPPKGSSGSRHKTEPLPPQAVPASAQVHPGGTVQIPLRVYGKQSQTVTYLIRSQPQFGKVIAVQQLEQEVSILTYKHTSALPENGGDLHDRLTIVAQDDNGTSASADVDIAIIDDPPLLAAPDVVEFGEVTLGSTVSRTLTIANHGGGVLEGVFAIDAPWSIAANYRLARSQEARFRVTLAASAEQEYRNWLRVPERGATLLHALAFAPITVAPQLLDLVGTPAAQRSGNLTISNRTSVDQTVRIEADPRLHLPPEVVVPANGTNTLSAFLASDDKAGIDETVNFLNGDSKQHLRVHALASLPPGPLLRASPTLLAFGSVEVGHQQTLHLHLTNQGGSAASATADAPAPFQVDRPHFTLEPGQETDLTVTMDPAWPGTLASKLTIRASGVETDLEVPVTASIYSRAAAVSGTGFSVPTVQTGPSATVRNLSGLPPVEKINVERVTPVSADLSWEPPVKDHSQADLGYRLDVRRLGLDQNGALQTKWITLPTVELTKTPGHVGAHLTELPPGWGITLRIVSLTPKGVASAPSSPIQFFTPMKTAFFTLQRVLLALFTLVLAGALWLRYQENRPARK